jgi:hypothetical protein
MKVRCPYKCDYCLNPKGETNHWWLRQRDVNQFTLLAWNDLLADQDGHEHICSESCAAKALSRWMTRRSTEFTVPGAMIAPVVEAAKRPN